MTAAVPPSPCRVALLDPGDFSPPYDLHLARALQAQGCEVALFGQVGNPDVPAAAFRHEHFYRPLARPGSKRLPSKLRQVLKGLCHGFDMLTLDGVLDKQRSEILHCQWLPLPVLDRQAVRWLRRKRPVVLTVHDSNPYNGAGSWLMRLGHADAARAVDAVVVHTAAAARRLVAEGVDPARIHQIPHGLLEAAAPASSSPSRPRNIPLVLLQFGKIKPYKGVDVLLEALTLVPPDLLQAIEVHIVGKPYVDTAPFRRFVEEKGLSGSVRFRFEFVEDEEMHDLLTRVDAVLLPYREIDASGVAMTAIAYGLPVLATRIDGFLELFEENGGASLVAPGDACALARVLGEWVASPVLLDRMADAMRRRRAAVPGWEEIARLTLSAYANARSSWAAGDSGASVAGLAEKRT